MNGSITPRRVALERAGDEHVVRAVERTEPAVVTVERLQAVVHDGHRDLVDGRGARQRERQFAEPAQQTRGPLGLLPRAAFAIEQRGALGFGALPRVDVDRHAGRTGDHTVRVAHRFAAALEPVRRAVVPHDAVVEPPRRAVVHPFAHRGERPLAVVRVQQCRVRFELPVEGSAAPVRRAPRDARPTRRVRCAGPSATSPFRPLPARVRAVARFAPHRSSGPVRPLVARGHGSGVRRRCSRPTRSPCGRCDRFRRRSRRPRRARSTVRPRRRRARRHRAFSHRMRRRTGRGSAHR